MSANEPLAIGIDLGGTGTKFGIVDRVGNVLFSSEMSTKKHKTVESFIDELYLHLNELIDKAGGIGRMRGIGMGAPNGNFYSGTIEYAPNLPWRGIIPIAKMNERQVQIGCNTHQRCQCSSNWRDDVRCSKGNEGFYS